MAKKNTINRGTTFVISGTAKKDGVPINLVGATIRFTMKSVEFDDISTDSTAVVKKDITTGTSLGAYTITINPADTAAVEPGSYFYSIKADLHSDFTEVYELSEGTIILDGDPTNRSS